MALYAIGDIQGCYDALLRLLALIGFDKQKDQLWLTGDLVNRGMQSLEVLRLIKNLGTSAQTVLGNHDLHLLAVYHGVASITDADTFQDVFIAEDCEDLLTWLQQQPLMITHTTEKAALVHAGIWPTWSLETAQTLSDEYTRSLQTNPVATLLASYGDDPVCWDEEITGAERLRFICNVFTRMRMLNKEKLSLVLRYKGDIANAPQELIPWFKITPNHFTNWRIIFGHWAALNGDNLGENNCIALDTGCAWGNRLTAYRLDDGQYFSVYGVLGENVQ